MRYETGQGVVEDVLPVPSSHAMQWAAVSLDGGPKRMCHIDRIPPSGQAYCLECGEPLIPKRGDLIRHHFAHTSQSECHGESAAHKLGKAIIFKARYLRAPQISLKKRGETIALEGGPFHYYDPVLERRLTGTPYIPDVLVQHDNRPVAIEILVTHTPEDEKIQVFRDHNIDMLEISAAGIMAMSPDEAVKHVLVRSRRRWLVNQQFDEKVRTHVFQGRSMDRTGVNQEFRDRAKQALELFRAPHRQKATLSLREEACAHKARTLKGRGIQGNPFTVSLRDIYSIVMEGVSAGKPIGVIENEIRSRGYIHPFADDTVLCQLVMKATGIDMSPQATLKRLLP